MELPMIIVETIGDGENQTILININSITMFTTKKAILTSLEKMNGKSVFIEFSTVNATYMSKKRQHSSSETEEGISKRTKSKGSFSQSLLITTGARGTEQSSTLVREGNGYSDYNSVLNINPAFSSKTLASDSFLKLSSEIIEKATTHASLAEQEILQVEDEFMMKFNSKVLKFPRVDLQAIDNKKSPYDILDVSPNATSVQIRKAYFKKAKEFNTARHAIADKEKQKEREDKLKAVIEAYDVLSDVKQRSAKITSTTMQCNEDENNTATQLESEEKDSVVDSVEQFSRSEELNLERPTAIEVLHEMEKSNIDDNDCDADTDIDDESTGNCNDEEPVLDEGCASKIESGDDTYGKTCEVTAISIQVNNLCHQVALKEHEKECEPKTSPCLVTNGDDSVEKRSKPYSCDLCGKRYTRKDHCRNHERAHENKFTCDICNKGFERKDVLKRHQLTHGKLLHVCKCRRAFNRADSLYRHKKTFKH